MYYNGENIKTTKSLTGKFIFLRKMIIKNKQNRKYNNVEIIQNITQLLNKNIPDGLNTGGKYVEPVESVGNIISL